jgi:hypothetical protein
MERRKNSAEVYEIVVKNANIYEQKTESTAWRERPKVQGRQQRR